MRLAEIDWTVIRGASIFLGLALVLGGALVSGAHYFNQQSENIHKREQGKLASSRARFLALDEERKLIEKFYPRYQVLESDGVIGGEHRLDWVEALGAAARTIKLPSLRYDINAQDTHVPEFPIPSGRFEVFVSEMNLQIGLLHENDLLNLFQQIHSQAKGHFSVNRCAIRRKQEGIIQAPTHENISAVCALQWLTVRQPQEGA